MTTTFRVRPARLIAQVALGATLAGLAIWGLSSISDDAPQSTGVAPCTDYVAEHHGVCEGPLLPECPTEDSDNCAWDAARMGNGTGRSFYVVDGVVTYTTAD